MGKMEEELARMMFVTDFI